MPDVPELLSGHISITLSGELTRLDVARMQYYAGRLGVAPEISLEVSQTVFPLLDRIQGGGDFIGYDHFSEFNTLTRSVNQASLTRAYGELVDPDGKITREIVHSRTNGESMDTLGLRDVLSRTYKIMTDQPDVHVRPRILVGLPPMTDGADYNARKPAQRSVATTVHREYAIKASSVATRFETPVNDNAKYLFLFLFAEEVRNRIS